MPSKTKQQAKTMTAACKSDKFRKKVDIPKDVACKFHRADKGKWHESLESEELINNIRENKPKSSDWRPGTVNFVTDSNGEPLYALILPYNGKTLYITADPMDPYSHRADYVGWIDGEEVVRNKRKSIVSKFLISRAKEMTKVDEKFEHSKDKMKDDDTDVRTLMKMAGISQKMEDNKEGEIDFDGMFTGVADGEIKVDEDLEKLKSLAGLSEKNVKRSVFSRDQEHDRFSLFKEFDSPKNIQEMDDPAHNAAREYVQRMEKGQYDPDSLLDVMAKKYYDPLTGGDLGSFKDQIMAVVGSLGEGDVVQGPWGQGGPKDPQVRDPQSPKREPDSAEIMDKYHELVDPEGDGSVAAMQVVDWVRDEFNVPDDYAVGLVDQAFDDANMDLSTMLKGQAANEAELDEVGANPDLIASAEKQLGVKLPGNISAEELNKVVRDTLIQKYERMSGEKIPTNATTADVHKMIKDYVRSRGVHVENEAEVNEKAPKGWEGTVKAMKDEPEIEEPYALAHWMKKKGYKSHKKEGFKEGSDTFRLVYPEARDVTADQIWSWYNDALANGEVARVDPDDIDAAIDQLEDIGRITVVASNRPGYPRSGGAAMENEDAMWEEFEKKNRKSEMFKEGSYDRMIIELIVEEMKKGKEVNDISETLGFDPDEVFYVVEFFKNKKLEEEASDEKEAVNESQERDVTLERIKYLTEYKN